MKTPLAIPGRSLSAISSFHRQCIDRRDRPLKALTIFVDKSIKILMLIVSAVYLLFLIRTLLRLDRAPINLYWGSYNYNVVPLKTITGYIQRYHHYNFNTWFNNLFGNILIFVPFGFITPYFIRFYRRVTRFLVFMVCTIFIIELLQITLHVGTFDVDDIILNSIGGILGFIFYLICSKALDAIRRKRIG